MLKLTLKWMAAKRQQTQLSLFHRKKSADLGFLDAITSKQ